MSSPSSARASRIAAAVLPVAVGPAITRIGSNLPPEASLDLAEGDAEDDRPAMGTMAREVADLVHRREEGHALLDRQLIPGPDRAVARHRGEGGVDRVA